MAEEKPIVPPLRTAVSEFTTPSTAVTFFTELVNRDDPAYVQNAPVKHGTLYSSMIGADRSISERFPALYFLRERKFQLSDQLVLWDWRTDEFAENTYNAAVTYIANNVDYPAFTRVSTIRRSDYEPNPTRDIGSNLTALLGVRITDGGQDYTYANGTIEGKGVEIGFVIGNGQIISGVITKEGTGVLATDTITITGDGAGAVVTPIVQPTTCYLTSQKKDELPADDPLSKDYIQITRVYETLPGPWLTTTRFDKDGIIATVATRRNIAADIVDEEHITSGIWTRTTHNAGDSFVSEEVKSTRAVPGNPMPSTKIEEDGKVLTSTKTLVESSTIVSSETLVGNLWTKTYKGEVADSSFVEATSSSYLVAWKIVDVRAIPGNPVPSSRLDDDGVPVSIVTTLKDTNAITTEETLAGGIWSKTTKKEISDLVAQEIVETRAIPGNPMVTTKIDEDGKSIAITKTLGESAIIVSDEVAAGGFWVKTYKEAVSDLVAYQVQEVRALPGNGLLTTKIDVDGEPIYITKTLGETSGITSEETLSGGFWVKTYKEYVSDLVAFQVQEIRAVPASPPKSLIKTVIDAEGDIMTETRTMVVGPPTLVTTNVKSGGTWTKTFGEPISDLVSWKVVQVRPTQNPMDSYEVSIPDLLPKEFAAGLPVTTHEQIVRGDASLPILATGDLYRSEVQQDFFTYKLTVRGRADISLPQTITNKEITSQFGGGDVTATLTLDLFNNLSLDEGLMVLTSEITHIDDQANGLAVKTSRIVDGVAWTPIEGTHVDEKYGISIAIERQTVDAGVTGGLSGGVYTEVRPHDKWKSITIASQLDVDSLPEDVQWSGSMRWSFPPELTDAVIDWAEATCGCSDSFSAVLIANVNQYSGPVKTRITEQFYNGPPPDDVTLTQFFPQTHHFGFAWSSYCGDDDGNCRTKSGAPEFHIPLCLHDDLSLSVGISHFWTFAATSPATLPHGSYIMIAPHVERWRFGVFRRVVTEIYVP